MTCSLVCLYDRALVAQVARDLCGRPEAFRICPAASALICPGA